MISTTIFDGFGKPKTPFADPPEAGKDLDLFGSFFSLSAITPPLTPVMDEASRDWSTNTKTAATATGADLVLPDTDRYAVSALPAAFATGQSNDLAFYNGTLSRPANPFTGVRRSTPIAPPGFSSQTAQPVFDPVPATDIPLTNFSKTAESSGPFAPPVTAPGVLPRFVTSENNSPLPELQPQPFVKSPLFEAGIVDEKNMPKIHLLEVPDELPAKLTAIIGGGIPVGDIQLLDISPQLQVKPPPVTNLKILTAESEPLEIPSEIQTTVIPFTETKILNAEIQLPGVPAMPPVQVPAVPDKKIPVAEMPLLEMFRQSPAQMRPSDAGQIPASETPLLEIPGEATAQVQAVPARTIPVSEIQMNEIHDRPVAVQPVADGPIMNPEFLPLEISVEAPPPVQPVPKGTFVNPEFLPLEISAEARANVQPLQHETILTSEFHQSAILGVPVPALEVPSENVPKTEFHGREIFIESPIPFPDGETLPTEFPLPEINDEPLNLSIAKRAVNYVAPTAFQPFIPNDLPKIFKDVSSIVKADNSVKASLITDAPVDQKIVDQIRQAFSGDSGRSQDQPIAEPLKPAKEFKAAGGELALTFDSSLKPTDLPTVFDAPTAETRLHKLVLDQVEPRLLDLSAIAAAPGEKRVLKMRLNPADLGTVEITIIKNAGGKINAHFQTDSPQAQQVLSDSLAGLRDSLERSGMQVGELDISCSSFSSAGNQGRGEGPREFGAAEHKSAETINFDGNSKTEDDQKNRLVNLRA